MSFSLKAALLIFMLGVFAWQRPLHQKHYNIIVADGMGYYNYLPATFIYHDHDYQFEWFPKVYHQYYAHQNEDPLSHFMVKYKDRQINLYYPGVSLLQLPFFFIAHGLAYLLSVPADGYAWPYQLMMALSAMFYAWVGLIVLHKIIKQLTQNSQAASLTIVAVLLGTNLYTYAIFNGCYSHVYSFFAITLFYSKAQDFFNHKSLHHVLAIITLAALVLTIRPVNLLTLLGSFFFFQKFSFKQVWSSFSWMSLVGPSLVLVIVLMWFMGITYQQTGALVANTYTIGHFTWHRWDHVGMNLLGFQSGVLWYTPLLLLPFTLLTRVKQNPKLLWLLGTITIMFLIYGFWWYFNIAPRTIVDITGIIGIVLALSFHYSTQKRLWILVTCLCIGLFQLKAYQLRKGILSANYTYAEYYRKMFFVLKQGNRFVVNPDFIIQQSNIHETFEELNTGDISTAQAHQGNKSATLNEHVQFAASFTYKVPQWMTRKGFPKVKVSFYIKRTEAIRNIHVVYAFSRNGTVYSYHVGYINELVSPNAWVYNEFGNDAPTDIKVGDELTVYFWNPDNQNEAYIDDLTTSFILSNGGDEITGE